MEEVQRGSGSGVAGLIKEPCLPVDASGASLFFASPEALRYELMDPGREVLIQGLERKLQYYLSAARPRIVLSEEGAVSGGTKTNGTATRLLLDFAVTESTDGLQQFALDLVALGYQVRCTLWPESKEHRIWPEVRGLAEPLPPMEATESVGLRLSHADSFHILPTPTRIGITYTEETHPKEGVAHFGEMQGLLVVTRTGALRFRRSGANVPMEQLSVEGLERLLHGEAPCVPPSIPFGLEPYIAEQIATVVAPASRASLLVLADSGEAARSTHLCARRVVSERVGSGRACIVVCLAVQAGLPVVESGFVILGRHHIAPQYRYLMPTAELIENDLLLGIQDIFALLAHVPEKVCETFGLVRFGPRLRELATAQGFDLIANERLVVSPRSRRRVGLAGPANIACGVAEEIRLLSEASPRPMTVLSERVEDCARISGADSATRCYERGIGEYGELLREVVERELDVLHIEYNHGLFAPEYLIPFVHQLRTLGVHTVGTIHAATKDVLPVALAFDEVIANTPQARDRLVAYGVPSDQVHVIPLPARPMPRLANAATVPEGTRSDSFPTVMSCGFALPHKGLLELVLAVGQLRQTYPEARLVLCTPPYPGSPASADYLAECQSVATEWGLGERVHIVSEFLLMEDLAGWLQAADILAFPYSRSADQDSSGAVRMALGAGRPIVVSELDIFSDLGEAVLRVPPGHVPALVRAIRSTLQDQALRARLVRQADQLAAQWQPEEIARRHWCEVYRAFGDLDVRLEGVFQSSDSFSQVLSNTALALQGMGCAVSIDPWVPDRPAAPLPSALAELAAKPVKPLAGDLTIRGSYPHRLEAMQGEIRTLLFPWEVTRLPEGFAKALERSVDYVLAPSRFVEEVLKASGVPEAKIARLAHGVDSRRFHPHVRPADLLRLPKAGFYNRPDLVLDSDSLTVFLHLGSGVKRKGTDMLLSAFCEEFTGTDSALLVVKTFTGNEQVMIWAQEAMARVANPPRIIIIREDAPGPLLPGYYTLCDCLVHPHRGEGFGLPLLEAMACGRPVITTDWGGPTDFCSADNAYLLAYELVPCRGFDQPVPADALWAEPSVQELRAQMRHVLQEPDEARRKGERAAADALLWSWEKGAYHLLLQTGVLGRSRE